MSDDNKEQDEFVDAGKHRPAAYFYTNPPANKLTTRAAAEAAAKKTEKRKLDAISDIHEIIPNDGWKKQFSLWRDATDEERKNIVFGMVMNDGAIQTRDIARFFGIDTKEVSAHKLIHDAAKAALKLKVQRNQISTALLREDNPAFKFFLGKQFAEQVAEPAHEGVAIANQTPPTIIFNEVKADNEELKAELEAAVHAAVVTSRAKA